MVKRTGKRMLVYGRRPRGAEKRARGGPVPKKVRRRSWPQVPGSQKRAAEQRRISAPMDDRKVYGPFGGSAS